MVLLHLTYDVMLFYILQRALVFNLNCICFLQDGLSIVKKIVYINFKTRVAHLIGVF
jgi:hypothetical protein